MVATAEEVLAANVLAAPVPTSNVLGTYFLFIVAGLLVGGAWTMYQSGSRVGTIVVGLLAVIALAGAVLMLLGVMG